MATDALGRLYVTDADVAKIRAALETIPDGKRGALLAIADEHGVRAQVAANLGGHWKVAAGIGATWQGPKPEAFVAVQGYW
jgi:hypothetical protein